MESAFITTNGVTLHTVTDGPADGEPIIFLHGFPDFWYGWHHQIPYFAEKGFRVIVPDQRGYNLSDKPKDIMDYKISTLARDIVGLMDALGYEKVHLVGHDWGAAVAWWVATMFPERLMSLNILNVPYPSIMLTHFRKGNLSQLTKSWYIFFFQLPVLPETLIEAMGYDQFGAGIQRTANPGSFSADDLVLYRAAWSQPGAMRAMINWYRALARTMLGNTTRTDTARPTPTISVPTQILWGEQDKFLGRELAEASIEIVTHGELVIFPKSSHWIQHDEPADVNKYIHDWIVRVKNNEFSTILA